MGIRNLKNETSTCSKLVMELVSGLGPDRRDFGQLTGRPCEALNCHWSELGQQLSDICSRGKFRFYIRLIIRGRRFRFYSLSFHTCLFTITTRFLNHDR